MTDPTATIVQWERRFEALGDARPPGVDLEQWLAVKLDVAVQALATMAREDWRGNKPNHITLAERTLAQVFDG